MVCLPDCYPPFMTTVDFWALRVSFGPSAIVPYDTRHPTVNPPNFSLTLVAPCNSNTNTPSPVTSGGCSWSTGNTSFSFFSSDGFSNQEKSAPGKTEFLQNFPLTNHTSGPSDTNGTKKLTFFFAQYSQQDAKG